MTDQALRTRIADTLGETLVHHDRSVHLALADEVIQEFRKAVDQQDPVLEDIGMMRSTLLVGPGGLYPEGTRLYRYVAPNLRPADE